MQVPESFTKSIISLKAERFNKWIEYKTCEEKKNIFSKAKKYDTSFLVYHMTNVFYFYLKESEVGRKKPFLSISMENGTFFKSNLNSNQLVIKGYDGSDNSISYKIKCLNPTAYQELVILLKQSEVYEDRKAASLIEEEVDEDFLFLKPIRDWSNDDVLNWSKEVLIGPDIQKTFFEVAERRIRKEHINGRALLSWNDDIINQFIRNFRKSLLASDIRNLRRVLKTMVETGYYDCTFPRVTKKIVKMLIKTRGPKNFSLLNMISLRKVFAFEKNIQNNILVCMYKTEEDSKKRKTFSVKLNIVENLFDQNQKRVRLILGKLLKVKDTVLSSTQGNTISSSSTAFGVFHVSLSIGNLQLEWVDSELVLIREVSSEKAILSCDVAKVEIEDGFDFSERLSSEILKWNVFFSYTTLKSSKISGNCQTFVFRILKFLGLEQRLGKGIRRFIDRMKHSGVCEKIFHFDSKFAKTFFPGNKEAKKYKCFHPSTHQELDVFVQNLFKVCPHFDRDYNDEFCLLKGFDRGFWLQYNAKRKKNKISEMIEFEPALRTDEKNWRTNGCPFTKPRSKEIIE